MELENIRENIRIVLVEPSHPGNIGGAARAMKTMGLSDLWVIKPKRYPDPQADWRAAGALDVLDAAVVVETLDAALDDRHWVVGTSTRNRRIPWPINDAKGVAEQVTRLDAADRTAILFGREDNGLSNEELARCNMHLQIPAAPEYSSLNLAMAVQVVSYEIYQASIRSTQKRSVQEGPVQEGAVHEVPINEEPISGPGQPGWDRKAATAGEVDSMLKHLQDVLLGTDFLQADNPGQTMTRLRRMFARIQLDETEVQILRGILKHVAKSANL